MSLSRLKEFSVDDRSFFLCDLQAASFQLQKLTLGGCVSGTIRDNFDAFMLKMSNTLQCFEIPECNPGVINLIINRMPTQKSFSLKRFI